MGTQTLLSLCVCLLLATCSFADKEEERHGAVSSKFQRLHQEAGHDQHMDHQAILGSKKLAEKFDELSPEESKMRLGVIATKMDADSDGFVTMSELTDWIYRSMLALDKEETDERFDDIDANNDDVITWEEYLHDTFGTDNDLPLDPEDQKLLEEDRRYFKAADLNGDGKLSMEEFSGFQNPEHYPHMHETLIEVTLSEKDTNGDGKIELKEFLGDVVGDENSEWYTIEKSRFKEDYDLDKDGFLDKTEVRQWLIPDLKETAAHEAEHLISSSDKDKDGQLTVQEIVDEHVLFVGSEATNFGEHLTIHEEF
uniref:Reticulocalbin-3 n=1 Tax=Steinernema glaseri TaxID=37863 RepID=A0A1I7ZN85_9BILA